MSSGDVVPDHATVLAAAMASGGEVTTLMAALDIIVRRCRLKVRALAQAEGGEADAWSSLLMEAAYLCAAATELGCLTIELINNLYDELEKAQSEEFREAGSSLETSAQRDQPDQRPRQVLIGAVSVVRTLTDQAASDVQLLGEIAFRHASATDVVAMSDALIKRLRSGALGAEPTGEA